MEYDVAVIGAGPAGLMAAKTAAEKGLKTIVIEKRESVSPVTRCCCQQLIMDENFSGETLKYEQDKIVFTQNNFSIDYNGPTLNITDKYYISPNGHKIHFAYKDGRPIVIKFDKGMLLQGLWEQCEKQGVVFRNATVAYDVNDSDQRVEIKLTAKGVHSTLMAKKLIVADGVNSRAAASLGMNKDRMYFTTALCTLFLLKGLKGYERTAFKTHMGLAYQSQAPLILCPTLADEEMAYLVVIGNQKMLPQMIFQNATAKSPLAPMLNKARLVKKIGCSLQSYSSMHNPARGNTLCIGDAAAFVEVETQGALMCGFHAGNAVYKELSGENGFEAYTRWWLNAFEFNTDAYLQVAQGYALVPTYSDDELDYLFALTEDEVLEGTFSQYKSPKLMWASMLRHEEKIQREKPELYNKIKNKKLSLSDTL
jgi:digeranylgeranylglycerophospholipid reductase